MILSARILQSVGSVNSFDYVDQFEMVEGDTPTIYFQLIDATQDRTSDDFKPAGKRYMPPVGATLNVTIDHIDDAKKITRAATQPFPLDPSIWSLVIMTTDKLKGTRSLKLTLSESGTLKNGFMKGAIRVQAQGCI